MNKNFKIYALIFIVVVAILALFEFSKKETIDWRKNFDVNKKTPFGLFVFNNEVHGLLKNAVSKVNIAPYDFYAQNNKKPHNILVVENNIDQESWLKILNEVAKGSDAMIISSHVPRNIADTIGFYRANVSFQDENTLKLTDKKFQNIVANIDKLPSGYGFPYVKENVEILGKIVEKNNVEQANFIKTHFGKGNIFVHSEPLFLSNYYLLQPKNTLYAEGVFSYLQDRETLWFINKNTKESQFMLRFILSQPALKYAWWVFLGGLLLFAIFNLKRKQRIIPTLEPLKNTSAEFVKSIGNLYLQEGDFHDMMAKKAQYFLNKVRIDLLINTENLDEAFAQKLHLKTGKPITDIQEALVLIKKAQDPYASVMKEDLVRINSLLDEILK